MVSKYRAKKLEKNLTISKIGDSVVNAIKNDFPKEKITFHVMELCYIILQSGELCEICSQKNGLTNCNACMNLNTSDEKNKIIENMKDATKLLEKENPIELMPNVMMNIAMSAHNPKNKHDIASIPGRIIKANGKVKASNPPEFGASNHLAKVLLSQKEYSSVMNIKYDREIDRAIRKLSLKEAIIDKGSFGIEPCAYIMGKDALDVTRKAIRIYNEVKK
jgi:predicted fused transcriptional regulator/phosphomethylpyrimidine kinase